MNTAFLLLWCYAARCMLCYLGAHCLLVVFVQRSQLSEILLSWLIPSHASFSVHWCSAACRPQITVLWGQWMKSILQKRKANNQQSGPRSLVEWKKSLFPLPAHHSSGSHKGAAHLTASWLHCVDWRLPNPVRTAAREATKPSLFLASKHLKLACAKSLNLCGACHLPCDRDKSAADSYVCQV